jgi:hypothetical protein
MKILTTHKNYFNSEEEKPWPEKQIIELEEVPNTFDYRGRAVKATLECGHSCFLTGDAISAGGPIHCKVCGES